MAKSDAKPAKTIREKRLNQKQLLFCREYIIDLNGTQGAVRAGYSKRSAARIANDLLKNPLVQAEIDRLISERNARLDRSAVDVIRDLQKLCQEAWQAGEFAVAHRCLETEGKHLGMFQGNGTGRPVRHREILEAFQRGELSVKDAALEFEKYGLPIPETVRILLAKEQPEPEDPGAGVYRVISDEEMEELVARRLADVQIQKQGLEARQQVVRKLRASVEDKFGPETKNGQL